MNVNAVTANTNNVVQDFALVLSSGDSTTFTNVFGVPNVTGVSGSPPVFIPGTNVSTLVTVTNGQLLAGQRVGGNSQFVAEPQRPEQRRHQPGGTFTSSRTPRPSPTSCLRTALSRLASRTWACRGWGRGE